MGLGILPHFSRSFRVCPLPGFGPRSSSGLAHRGDRGGMLAPSLPDRRKFGPNLGRSQRFPAPRPGLRRQRLGRVVDEKASGTRGHPRHSQRPPPFPDSLVAHTPVVGHGDFGFGPDRTDQVAAHNQRVGTTAPHGRPLISWQSPCQADRRFPPAIFTRQFVPQPAFWSNIRTIQQLEPFGVDHGVAHGTLNDVMPGPMRSAGDLKRSCALSRLPVPDESRRKHGP